jgi:hypothetical protein
MERLRSPETIGGQARAKSLPKSRIAKIASKGGRARAAQLSAVELRIAVKAVGESLNSQSRNCAQVFLPAR